MGEIEKSRGGLIHFVYYVYKCTQLYIHIDIIASSFVYGFNLLGSLGNKEALLIFFRSKKNMTTLSRPIPPPA